MERIEIQSHKSLADEVPIYIYIYSPWFLPSNQQTIWHIKKKKKKAIAEDLSLVCKKTWL